MENANGWKTVEGGALPIERPGMSWKTLEESGLVLSEFVPG